MGIFFLVLVVAAVVYGLVGLYLGFRDRKRQYSPTHRDAKGAGQAPFQPWRAESGAFLGYFRPTPSPRRLVVLFHAKDGEALDRVWADELVPAKDLLVLAEYPGYGARAGKISEAAFLADAVELVAQARRTWGDLPVTAVGEGLGAAVCSYLASLRAVDRLALISPFASEEVAPKRHWFFLTPMVKKDRHATLEYLKSADAPLHVVHGTLDEYVPLEHGRAVVQAYSGARKQLDEVPGCGHANLVQAILHSPFTSRFRDFIAE